MNRREWVFLGRCAACVLGVAVFPVSAGPWTKPKGDGEMIMTLGYYSTDETFDSDRDKVSIANDGTFRKTYGRVYLEQGLADQVTFLAKAELVDAEARDEVSGNSSNTRFADPEFGLRFRIRKPEQQGDLALAMQGMIKVPTGHSANGNPPVDNDQYDLDVRFLMGQDFGRGYWAVEMGPRFRRGPPADELRADGVISVDLVKQKLALVNETFITIGLKNEEGAGAIGTNVTRPPDYDLLVHQISLMYKVSKIFAFQGGIYQHLWGRNTGGDGGAFVAFHLYW